MSRRDNGQRSMDFIQDRALANTVMCPECFQPVGDDCTNIGTGRPLSHVAAHWRRTRAANQAMNATPPRDETSQ